MASKILRGLTIAAGTGLAIGFGGKRRNAGSPMSASDEILTLEPLLDRLDRIEARMSAMEASSQSATTPMLAGDSNAIAEVNRRVHRQEEDIETLQVQLSETRQRVASGAVMAEQRFAEVARSTLETMIRPYIEDLRARLQKDTRESMEASLRSFERLIDSRISRRIATVEKALADQAAVVTTLSQRAVESEANLQRLISAVERLFQRNDARPASPASATTAGESPALELPFERHLSEAIKRKPASPGPAFDSGFRARILKEDDDKPRHRKPLTRI